MPDTLLATAQRLRILAKAYDVSLCDVEGVGTIFPKYIFVILFFFFRMFCFDNLNYGCCNSRIPLSWRLCVDCLECGWRACPRGNCGNRADSGLAKGWCSLRIHAENFRITTISQVLQARTSITHFPEVTLLELLGLVSLRHASQLMQQPLPAVAADMRDDRQLQQLGSSPFQRLWKAQLENTGHEKWTLLRQASTAAEDLLELATGLIWASWKVDVLNESVLSAISRCEKLLTWTCLDGYRSHGTNPKLTWCLRPLAFWPKMKTIGWRVRHLGWPFAPSAAGGTLLTLENPKRRSHGFARSRNHFKMPWPTTWGSCWLRCEIWQKNGSSVPFTSFADSDFFFLFAFSCPSFLNTSG